MYLITGMHRSGTSMTAQILNAMGAPFTPIEEMIGANEWNKGGYFESKRVVDLNTQLMLGAGIDTSIWLNPPESPFKRLTSFMTTPKWRYFLPRNDQYIARRANKISQEIQSYGTANTDLFVKDPRFAITHQAWTKHSDVKGVILSFRNPESVARSIKKRDLFPRFVSFNTWYQHNVEFLKNVMPETPIILIDYDRFFDDSASDYISRLAVSIAEVTKHEMLPEAVENVINRAERHYQSESLDRLPHKIREAYKTLIECSETGPVWISARLLSEKFN